MNFAGKIPWEKFILEASVFSKERKMKAIKAAENNRWTFFLFFTRIFSPSPHQIKLFAQDNDDVPAFLLFCFRLQNLRDYIFCLQKIAYFFRVLFEFLLGIINEIA